MKSFKYYLKRFVKDTYLFKTNVYFKVRDEYGKSILNSFYNGTMGTEIFHIIPEVALTYHNAYLVPKSSPFIPTFNAANMDAREFGFKIKANRDYLNFVYKENIKSMENHQNIVDDHRKVVVIKLRNLKNVFILFAICLTICCIVFIAEVLLYKRN